jgi:type VI secretion system secreted protein Hcp
MIRLHPGRLLPAHASVARPRAALLMALVVVGLGLLAASATVAGVWSTPGAERVSPGVISSAQDRLPGVVPNMPTLPGSPNRQQGGAPGGSPQIGSSPKRAVSVAVGEVAVQIEGTKQGRFKGEGTRDVNKDRIVGVRFEHHIGSAASTGKRDQSGDGLSPGTLMFTKQWGAASPQIALAAATGEALKTVMLEFTGSAAGSASEAEVAFVMTLSEARIVRVRQYTDERRFFEDVTIAYDSMIIEHVPSKTQSSIRGRD